MAKKQLVISTFYVFLCFLLATIVISFPLVLHMKDYLFGLGDELLITWIMNWNIYAFTHSPLTIFQANIFYPYHNALAYSDAFFTNSLIAFFPLKLFGEPVVAYNVNYLLAHSLLGVCTFLLVRYLTKSIPAGIIAGTLMSFSTYTVTRYVHLQLMSTWWIPLCLVFLFLYIDTKAFRYLIGCSVTFLLQAANSFQPAYFLGYLLVVCIVYCCGKDRKKLAFFKRPRVFILTLMTLSMFFLLGLPYLQTSREFGYTRDIRDTINFANRQEYLLFPSDRTRLASFLAQTFYGHDTNPLKHDGYLGACIMLLFICCVVYRIFWRKKYIHVYWDLFLFITASAYVLSLGPALQWFGHVVKVPFPIPLPYAVLYYLVPGFNGFRNSARWELLVVLGMAVCGGIYCAQLFKSFSQRSQWLITGIICLLVLVEIPFPIQYKRVPRTVSYPPVYTYLASLPSTAVIIEMPIYNWNMLPNALQEQMRLLYSTKHHKIMVNGTSGFSPPAWQHHTEELFFSFPDKATVSYLRSIDVSYIVVHADEYSELFTSDRRIQGKAPRAWETIDQQLQQRHELRLVKKFNHDYVYKLL